MKHQKIGGTILLIVLVLISVVYFSKSDKQYIDNRVEKSYLAASGDASSTLLESLVIEDYPSAISFSAGQKEYNIDILENEVELKIDAKAVSSDAKIEITGNKYMKNNRGTITITVSKDGVLPTVYKINYTKKKLDYKQSFSYKNSAQTFMPNYAGYYKISLWGAQGNNGTRLRAVGGLGGFTSGELFVAKNTPLYFYVGEHRTDRAASFNAGSIGGSSSDTVNGGSANGYGGGGATDVRLVSGTWNNVNSLRSRIMVAGGGGGATDYAYAAPGGAAGGLIGFSGYNGKYPTQGVPNVPPTGGTQISGGKTSVVTAPGAANEKGVGGAGSFGVGGNAHTMWGSGGGGGYFGGGGAGWSGFSVDSGAGGSSFISGHPGVVAIKEDGTPKADGEDATYHYSGYKFANTEMIDGKSEMPKPDGMGTQVGNAGNGYAKIELVKLASKNNYLKNIHFDDGSLSPVFDPTIEEYELELDTYTENVNIDWTVDDDTAMATGQHNYKVEFGSTTQASITVTSENGDIRIYTLNMKRKPLGADEHSTKLANILLGDNKLEPVFSSNNTVYNTIILTNVFDLEVTPIPFDSKAKIEITGNKLMLENQGVITIKVTSEVVPETIYTINYKKLDAIVEDSFDYTGNYQTFIVPNSGYYKISLWGAQGNNSTSLRASGGAGGYTSGIIRLEKDTKLYFYVGQHRSDRTASFNAGSVGGSGNDGNNGGKINGYGGGGATDVRLTPGSWNDVSSLRSRIMVAGGGGGATDYAYPANGGAAGGLVGFSGYNGKYPTIGVPNIPATGGTQISGGKTSTLKTSGGYGTVGGFGFGGNGNSSFGSGGGGGYYGGGGAGYTGYSVDSGAGGSSYISGHPGSIAINEDGTPKSTTYKNITDSYHYSTRYFTETKMIDGKSEMPTHDETGLMLGNNGNGFANIRLVESLSTNNYLEKIEASTGEFKEEFDPLVTEYNLEIDTYKSAVNISGIAYDKRATVQGNGKYTVEYGEMTVATIQVTSDAGDVKTYTINITRKPLGEDEHTSKLANLKIDKYEKKLEPTFDSLTYDYNVTISNNVINLDIKTVPYDPHATVKITGDKLLLNERGTVMITVREPNSEDTVYRINYVKTNIIADYEYLYTGGPQTFIAPYTGYYNIELWGAQGNNVANLRSVGGLGAYTRGLIYLEEGTILYVYVGEHRLDRNSSYNAGSVGGGQKDGVNGGQINGYGGGGATDVRLVSGNWNDTSSLRSRIMVAGGGGGGSNYAYPMPGGAGGALVGPSGFNGKYPTRGIPNTPPTGGTQIAGGATSILRAPTDYGYGTPGGFGPGGNGNTLWGSGGGGGYYGGGGGGYTGYSVDSGAGGSSYISGHAGSIAIIGATNTTPKVNSYTKLEDSYHYSNYVFKDTEMIDGDGYTWTTMRGEQTGMPTKDKTGVMTGNSGNGFGKISYVELSANNYLESLTLKVGEEEKDIGFDSLTEEYNITLDPLETEIELTGVPYDVKATVEGNGSFDVDAGTTVYQIKVTAQNDEERIYTVNITREKSSDAIPLDIEVNKMLSNLCGLNSDYCNYEFLEDMLNYEIKLPFDLEEIELKAIPKNKYQTVEYYQVTDTGDVRVSDGNIKLGDDVTYKVAVTSEDLSKTTEYIYHFVRDMDGNNLLKMITITNPDVEINNFKSRVFEYYLSVDGDVTKFDVDALPQNEKATVEVTGADNFEYGKSNDVVIKVTAPNGVARDYVLHVYREQDTNVFLGKLQVKNGENEFLLSPSFSPYLNNYTVEVDYEYDTVEIVAEVADANTSQLNGPSEVTLNTGNNEVILSVTDKMGNGDINLYVVNIIRKKNSDARLKSLSIDGYTLVEEFNPDNKEYSVIVPEEITSLDVTALPMIDSTKVTIKGDKTLYQTMSTITISTLAEDKTKDTYKINVYKQLSDNNYLASLTIDGVSVPDFDREKLRYEVEVLDSVNEVMIEGIPENGGAVVTGNGKYAISSGENTITLMVESETQKIREYTIVINRAKNSNTNLLRVENNQGSQVSKTEDGVYVINVQNEINSIEVKGIPDAITSTVRGNGIYALNVGDNKIPLTVVAEDGSEEVHIVNVIRDKSRDDDLKFLYVEEGSLNPRFSETTVYYDVKVPNEVTEVHVTAETEDKNATYEIIGDTTNLMVDEERQIIVRVTAQAGNTKDYTISVVRQKATEENLRLLFLETNRGELTPVFQADTLNYTLEVEHDITDITITAEAESENVRVIGTGKYELRVGKNVLAVVVIGEDGVQRDYQIVVTRKPSNDATLASLVVKGQALNPVFQKNTLKYKLNSSSDYLEFTRILPTEEEATYVIEGNQDFKVGMNTVKIIVTAPDGVTTLEYIITVTRDQSKNNNLASLEVVGQTLVPDYNKGITYYTVNVGEDVNSVNIKATPEDAMAVVTGTGVKKIEVGSNTFTIEVLSESGSTKTYTITVTKDGSTNNNLNRLYTSEGEVKPDFSASNLEYTLNVGYEVETITVYGILEDNKATVTGLGDYSLKVGPNEINVSVTSESGDTKIYQIIITRAELISANIIYLEVENYTLDTEFDSMLTEYFVNVNNETEQLNLNVVLEDSEATYEVIGNDNLSVGINTVTIRVTARDSVTTKDYNLTVNRQMSTNNYLASIEIDNGVLVPEFNRENLEYSIEVERNISKIMVNAVAEDESAQIISGIGEHSLVVGENKINIRVKSSVGVYRTYILTVNRKKSDNAYLSSLEVKNGNTPLSLNELFVKTDNDYTLRVANDVENIQIIGKAEDEWATVTGSGIKTLVPGENNFEISVASESGMLNVYNLVVTKDLDLNNNVLDIIPSVGELNIPFDASVHEYDLVIPDTENFLEFEVKLESLKAKVTGHESEMIEHDSVRKIVITNEASEENVYTFNIIKDKKSLALLKDLKVDGYEFEFEATTLTYNIQVSESKKKLLLSEITAVPMDEGATVNLMGDLVLTRDIINIYTIEVIAKDGYTTETYTLNITRDSDDYTIRSNLYEIVRYDSETEEDYVIGIQPSTVISDFKNNFENDVNMLHVYRDTTEVSETDLTATAFILKLEKDGYVYDTLRVIVRGDLTSDGKVNITDQVKIINYVGRTVTFNKYEMLAGDLTFDGKVNITDQVKLINYVGRTVSDLNKKPTN